MKAHIGRHHHFPLKVSSKSEKSVRKSSSCFNLQFLFLFLDIMEENANPEIMHCCFLRTSGAYQGIGCSLQIKACKRVV